MRYFSFTVTQFYRMPDLFRFDDFQKCKGRSDSAEFPFYCVVNTFIKPDDSDLYDYISEFSKNQKQHYRHDKIQRGICLEDCLNLLKENNNSKTYYTEIFPMDSKLTFDFVSYQHFREDRKNLDKIVNMCVNTELQNNHNLRGYSSIEYCIRHDQSLSETWLDKLFKFLIISLFTVTLFSSIHDQKLCSKSQEKHSHYIVPLRGFNYILTAFSIHRNWKKLVAIPKEEFEDLRCMNAIKTIMFLMITKGHVLWYFTSIPFSNPIYLTKMTHSVMDMIILNGENMPNTFFVYSAFLTSIMLYPTLKKKNQVSIKFFFKAIFYRYLRLATLMSIFILFIVTYLHRLGSGPLWERINYAEMQFCKKNWWINLLLLNNYFSGDEKVGASFMKFHENLRKNQSRQVDRLPWQIWQIYRQQGYKLTRKIWFMTLDASIDKSSVKCQKLSSRIQLLDEI